CWKDLQAHVTWREMGQDAWRRPAPDEEVWYWDDRRTEIPLESLGLDGGKVYDVCVSAGARDPSDRPMEFPWCGRVRTSHQAARFHLVEKDGLVEWEGPHQLPVKSRNVLAYRIRHRRVEEDELARML